MRKVESNTVPEVVQRLQGRLLINILMEKKAPDAYEYVQYTLPESTSANAVVRVVEEAYTAALDVLDANSLRPLRALTLGTAEAADTEVLACIERECQRLRIELDTVLAELQEYYK